MKQTIIHNAKVYLEREKFAEAMLIDGEIIIAAGTHEEIFSLASPEAEKIDAKGNLLLPGFNDSHMHLYAFGRNMDRIQANGIRSIEELIERGRQFINERNPAPGTVISGTGWNQELFTDDKRLPCRHDIDRISDKHAIILNRICGHSMSCNTMSLEMAGISRNSPIAEGELLERDENGDPTGIIGEGPSMNKVRAIIPPFKGKQLEEQLLYAMKTALKNGITSIGTRDITEENYLYMVDAYSKVMDENDIKLRVNLQCTIENDTVFEHFQNRGWKTGSLMGHPLLKMGASKLFADGSLGARTAFMRKPYKDDPSSRGFRIHSPGELNALVKKHHENGYQVIIHAIGDAAIEDVLNAFEKATGGGENKLRHGIVHCQITDKPLLQRIADNGILAFVQPIFLTSDLHFVESRVGKELASTSYAHASMKKLSIKAVYGTDAPIESMNPLFGIDCAVNRRDLENDFPASGFYPEECVDVYTAVDAYTEGSAYAEFDEDKKGRIRAGFFADLVLLDKDIFSIPKKEIKDTNVLWTMAGGEIVSETKRTAYTE